MSNISAGDKQRQRAKMNKIDESLAMSHFAPLEVKVKSVFPKSFGKQDLPGGRKLADALCRAAMDCAQKCFDERVAKADLRESGTKVSWLDQMD